MFNFAGIRSGGTITGVGLVGIALSPQPVAITNVTRSSLARPGFNEIIHCPIPIDMNTLRAMKRGRRSASILYLWRTYRTLNLKRPAACSRGRCSTGSSA